MSSTSKPISHAEFCASIKELTDDTALSVRKSLETSLAKLDETNEFLRSEISDAISDEDRELYEETILENKGVIVSQRLKLDSLIEELRLRGLVSEVETEGVFL